MKKICMTALLAMAALTGATAQDEKPTVSFKIPVAESKTKSFAVALRPGAAPAKIRIDWGDGNIVESDVEIAVYDIYGVPTSLQGKPVGTGVVRLFGPDIASLDITFNAKLDEEKVTEIDVTNAPELIDLTAASNDIEAVDFSRNPRLERVSLTNNRLTQADFSANPDIVRIELINNSVSSIALPDEPKVEYLQLNGNPLGRLDISGMPKLKSLYAVGCGLTEFVSGDNTELKTLSLSKNSLTALDITRLTGLGLSNKGSLSATDNKLTELKWSEFPRTVNIDRNCFALDKLPVPENTPYKYTYGGQTVAVPATVDGQLDLSAQATLTGLADGPQPTSFTVVAMGDEPVELAEGTDYTIDNGVITFSRAFDSVVVRMSTQAFPATVAAPAVTTPFGVAVATAICKPAVAGATPHEVFSLQGVPMGSEPARLPKGIYISNGKKIVVK